MEFLLPIQRHKKEVWQQVHKLIRLPLDQKLDYILDMVLLEGEVK